MKNIIPLIVSVVLGLAAVFVVSKILMRNGQDDKKKMVNVVVAAKNLDKNAELKEGMLVYRRISAEAAPKNALLWENVNLAYGQVLPHSVSEGEIILFTDIRMQVSLADCVQDGEWTVPITFSDPVMISLLRVDDEIAILQTRKSDASKKSENLLEATENGSDRETTVLLPCVRILGFANKGGRFRDQPSGTSTIFVSLPPQQAMILTAAQRESELFPALRKRNDATAINRRDGGVVNGGTFSKIREGLKVTELPEIPDARDSR